MVTHGDIDNLSDTRSRRVEGEVVGIRFHRVSLITLIRIKYDAAGSRLGISRVHCDVVVDCHITRCQTNKRT